MALHTLTYAQTAREIGRFLQINEDPDQWSTLDSQRVDDVILRGSRSFYWPPATMLADKALVNHTWSFCVDALSVTLGDATRWHDLPSDFMRMTAVPSIVGSDLPMEEVSESDLRNMANASAGSGYPQYYTVRRDTPSSEALLFQIGVYPLPNGSSVTLEGEYLFDPTVASEAQAPILPSWAAEAYLAAMKYAADAILNHPNVDPKLEQDFKELLAAAILFDKQIGGPS